MAGDHLTQPEFHRRYTMVPEVKRAELVNGVVFMPSPVSYHHGRPHAQVMLWLGSYAARHPELECLDNTTLILDFANELQPDAMLITRPEHGGQTSLVDGYIHGAPEFVVEITHSSASYDLFEKKDAYCRAGTREYLCVLTEEHRVIWWYLNNGGYNEIAPEGGILSSVNFDGLRLNVEALLSGDSGRLLGALENPG